MKYDNKCFYTDPPYERFTIEEQRRGKSISNNLFAIITLLMSYFKNDESKTALWLSTSNPILGNSVPIEMIICGRSSKLLQFIENSIDDNKA